MESNKQTNEQNRIRGIETWKSVTAVRGEGRGGYWLKEGEGISQSTYIHDPWSWTTVLGLPEGLGGAGWRGSKGKIGTTVIAYIIKYNLKIIKF